MSAVEGEAVVLSAEVVVEVVAEVDIVVPSVRFKLAIKLIYI